MNESNSFEWPEIKCADKKKTVSLWVLRESFYKAAGNTLRRFTVLSDSDADGMFSCELRDRLQPLKWTGPAVRIPLSGAMRRNRRGS